MNNSEARNILSYHLTVVEAAEKYDSIHRNDLKEAMAIAIQALQLVEDIALQKEDKYGTQ